MRRIAWAMFMIGGVVAPGQAQNDTARGADKVDRATAYYHYMLAHIYSEMAAASGGKNQEYLDKASEKYKAAIKADPQTPLLREEYTKGLQRLVPLPLVFRPRPPSSGSGSISK